MSEGELKKRLQAFFDACSMTTIETDFGILFCRVVPNDPFMFDFIDEAKKDMLENYHNLGEHHTQPDFVCIDYKKWKKWFGEST